MSQEQSYNNPPPSYYQDDEITLKELLLKLGEFAKELWRSKMLLVVMALVCIGGLVLKGKMTPVTYSASMSFLVEGNDGSQTKIMSPFGPLEFGSVENNKITELARSSRIIHKVLLTKKVLDDEYDYIANHLIDIYKFQETWAKEPMIAEFKYLHLGEYYFVTDSLEIYGPKDFRALDEIQVLLAGNKLISKKGMMAMIYDDETDIFRLDVKTINEPLSLILIEAIFNELKLFYTEETVGRTTAAFELVSAQADSLQVELDDKEMALAGFQDRKRGFTSSIPDLRRAKLQREVTELTVDYNESARSRKSLELLLMQETPEFQIIDQTFIPIEEKPSMVKDVLLGGFLGLFLAGIYVIGRKIVRDAMAA